VEDYSQKLALDLITKQNKNKNKNKRPNLKNNQSKKKKKGWGAWLKWWST
jgi:hypothetical protein